MPVAVRRGTQQRDGIEPSMNLTENLERERVGGNYPQRLEGRLDGCYSVALYETGRKGRPLNRPCQIIW